MLDKDIVLPFSNNLLPVKKAAVSVAADKNEMVANSRDVSTPQEIMPISLPSTPMKIGPQQNSINAPNTRKVLFQDGLVTPAAVQCIRDESSKGEAASTMTGTPIYLKNESTLWAKIFN